MPEKKKISVRDLAHALTHIRALIFGDHALYDDAGRFKEVLHEETIVFAGEDKDAMLQELHREIEHLKQLVHKDELTGVLNRRGVREEFGRFFNEALYTKAHPEQRKNIVIKDLSVIFFDIDNFKKINDTYGHDEGDRVLKAVAHTLSHHVRDIDAVGRFGGEEFVVALLGADESQAYAKGEEIRTTISEHVGIQENEQVTVSVGVASLKASNAETLEQLIGYADKAMYEAKRNRGKNNTVRHSELV